MIKIEKEKIALIIKKILAFIPKEVVTDEDSYWLVSSDEWTNFSSDINPDVGSLNDDWNYLSQIISENRPISSSDLDRLSSILRIISQEINPI